MSDVTKDTGVSGTVAIGKSITIHTASGAQTANVMNADMIVNEKPTTNKDLASKAPTINLVDSMVMEAVSDAFDDMTTIEYQSVNNVGKLSQVGQAGVIYLCSVWEEVENPTGNPHDLGYYVYTNGEYVLTTDTSVQSGTTYYTKAMATDEYIWLASESRYEPLGQAKVDLTGLLFAGSATSGGTAYKAAAIPFGRVDSTSTSTKFTASVEGITALEDGVCCYLTNDVVTSASGFTLNINGLGAKPVYTNLADATRDTTIFNKIYTMLFVYNSTRVSGGCWDCYRGYDSNTNTIGYQIRTNNGILKTTDAFRYYKVLFTSADNTHWVPSSVDSTNNATSARDVNQRPINPFGPIVYCHSTSAFAANADVTAAAIWQQYAITLGYSFNRTGAALTLTTKAPVYIKCTPQSDGSAIIDADTPYVQTLPSTEDGKIYIYFGIAYSATAVELRMEHPVFYYKGGAIRVWVNQAQAVGKVELDKYNSDATESSEGTPANGQTDVKVDNVSIGTVVTSYAPGTAQRPYVAPSWYALNTKLSDKQDTISDLNEIRSGASKGSTAVQPTDIRDELDPGGNGEIADSAAIATYIEAKAPIKPTTSTDNAIARYDGTSGNLQNSGVTINDSNHVTAAKFITNGGTSSQFVKGDGSLDSSAYVKEGMWMMPTNAFGGSSKAIQINLINNGFYAAHLRATVTLSGFTAGVASQLFDGNYETALTLPAGQTGVILIDSGSTPLFGSYSYGYTYFSFYYNYMPDSISMRVYGTRSSGGENWYDLGSATAFYASSGAYCYRIQNSGTYNCKKWEITIVAKSDTIAKPCQIDHQFSRGATAYMPVVTKFAMKQDLWGDVEAPKFIKRGGTSSQFLKADGSVDNNTYLTSHQDISGKADKSAQSVKPVSNNETYNIVEGKKVTIATNGGTSDVDVVQLGSVKGAPSATSSAAAKEIPTWQGVKEYVQTNSPAPTAGDGISISGSTISLKTASTSEVGGIKSASVDVEPNIYKVTVDVSEQTAEVPIPNASANKTGVLTKEDFATFSGKQDALTFDPAPTINSTRPVTSGGVYEALEQKADKSSTYTKTEVNNLVSTIHNDVIIGALPSTGVANKIYRVPGTNSYADYAWDGTQFVKLAEFEGSIFVQLTEAQYDALSDTEKNNGTWYFIEEE